MDENNQPNTQPIAGPAPTPAPIPAPTPAPIPEPTPAPIPEPAPAPIPEPTPAPIPEPAPAPIPEPTPAPIPEPTSAPEQIINPNPTGTQGPVATPAEKKKKSKAGVIILIIVLLMLIGGGIVTFILLRDDPEKTAATAAAKFADTLSAITSPEQADKDVVNKNLQIDGTINYEYSSKYESEYSDYSSTSEMKVGAKLKAEFADNGNAQIGVDLDLNTNQDNGYSESNSYNISLNGQGISIQEGDQYIKLDGIKEIYKEYLASYLSSLDGIDVGSYIDRFDDQWFIVDVEELLNEYINNSSYNGQEADLSCIEEKMKEELPKTIDYNDFYDLISLELYEGNDQKPNDGTLYVVKIDSTKILEITKKYTQKYYDFIYKDLPNVCSMGVIDDYSEDYVEEMFEDIDQESIDEVMADFPEIFVEINKKKEISRIFFELSKEDGSYIKAATKVSVDLKFSYPETLEIEAPKNAESLADFVQAIIEDVGTYYQNYYRNQYKTMCDSFDEETRQLYSEYCLDY